MFYILKKFLFIFTFNFALFLLLMIGIQNSSNKKKINLLIGETVALPVSFIVGISFISGSLASGFLNLDINKKR